MCMGMGFPMGPGIPWESHGNGNKTQIIGNGREWETTSAGMGITCTPMRIYSQRFYASERVFSTAGRLLEKRRTNLNPQSTNALLILHSNMK